MVWLLLRFLMSTDTSFARYTHYRVLGMARCLAFARTITRSHLAKHIGKSRWYLTHCTHPTPLTSLEPSISISACAFPSLAQRLPVLVMLPCIPSTSCSSDLIVA